MRVFAAEFPASETATIDGLLDCCRTWIVGSPYYPWKNREELTATANQIVEHDRQGHHVEFGRVALADGAELGGVQYSWNERDEQRWVTEIVGRKSTDGLWVSVRVTCELLAPGISLPSAKKPHFLKTFMAALGGGKDGEFETRDRPHRLHDGDLSLAERIITGKAGNALPVVYISVGFIGRPFVDADKVARWLSGLAHVVVEPHRAFSRALAPRVASANVYGGAVGIYWPKSAGEHFRLIPRDFEDSEALEGELQRLVRNAQTYARPTRSAAWMDLREALSRMRIEELRSSGTASLDEYMAAFDEENKALRTQRDGAQRELERLRETVRRLQNSRPSIGVAPGNEQDLYPGEVADIVVRALMDARTHSGEGSRKRMVLDDLLGANSLSGHADQIEQGIKSTLSTTDRVTATEIAALEEIGFNIEDGGKHYKATFAGDPRLTFTLFKTASDHRSGKNLASDMIRTLLK